MSASELLHYGHLPFATAAGDQRMNRKIYCLATAVVFAVIGLVHLVRIVLEWDAAIGGWSVPMWPSWLALVVSTVFAYYGFKHGTADR
jgi:hypothetical protein